ncbi:HNH endonuclease signature motif containing protein [Nocardioides halotolerans]|uniref:HNH endonuclease signature motif containing protein n=1 Tax=Nocardioides halotolerans TaxID=433660 RepID=UPI0004221137|nr:HNH endonuclease signature motif containing protein [Nocardioides halotolerans]
MTQTADRLPDTAPLPRDLLLQVREARATAEAAEVSILELALAWAAANPALPGQEPWEPAEAPSWLEDTTHLMDEEEREWIGLPALRWDAPAAFAAANAMTTMGGKAVLRDALVLAHRLPGFWAAVRAGQVPARLARRAAQAVLGQPADVCGYLDQQLVRRVTQSRAIGPVVLDRLVDEAMLRLHAEQRELEQLEALDARHVTIDPATLNHTGIAAMDARADWADLAPFDETLSAVAAVLAQLPEHQHDSLDVRRSVALGILADPARAQALLDGDHDAKPSRSRDLVATLELTDLHLLSLDPIVSDADLRSHLDQVIRQWAGRPDVRLVIKPVRRCGADDGSSHGDHPEWRYSPTARDRETVHRRDRTCVHPHCTRPARHCDCDHITPYDQGGPTCPCNLASC